MRIIFLILSAFTLTLYSCKSSIVDDPSTTIQYTIPEPAHVKLTVENSYNTVIAVLMDADVQAGNYGVPFQASNLAEGIYFYILEVKGLNSSNYYKHTRHMILVK